ncbi:NUDIX hydrolase [Nocardioides sp.]|uniref:NUDIX hydrolase n=1 Tax=Nocardioides sp. TaxID=35761 RepID=UPI002ED62074
MTEPPLEDTPASWPVLESEDLFRDDWVMALRRDTVRAPDGGETFRRLVLEHPGAAVVLAVDRTGRACLLRQYRHPGQAWFVELPAGLCDVEGEDPLVVARRELREEAGLIAEEWTLLGSTYSSPGVTSERVHLYLAQDLTDVGRGDFDPSHEEAAMEVFWAPLEDVHEAILDGRVSDAPTVIAVLLALTRGLSGRGPSPE